MNEKSFDIVIIGAGLTGLLAALILSEKNLKIALIDKNNFHDPASFLSDFRTTAISEGTKILLNKAGLWSKIKAYSQPIKEIKVYDRKNTNKISFQNPDKDSFLGYIVENKFLKKVLFKEISLKDNIFNFENIKINNIEQKNSNISCISYSTRFVSKLLIAADGKNSYLRKLIKTNVFYKKYDHKALVINLLHQKNHNSIAYELFFKYGPLAILPMKKNSSNNFCSSIVWSHNSQFVESLEKKDNNYIIPILNEKISYYLGNIISIKQIKSFDLSAHLNTFFYDDRVVYLGDSAHSIHPIAGQGWNLGARGIFYLLNSINKGINLGLDIGSQYICKKYHEEAFQDAYMLYQVTDKLNKIFLYDSLTLKYLRNFGFNLIDKNNKLNNFISKYAMSKRKFDFNNIFFN